MGYCVAFGCKNRAGNTPKGVTFHKFPKDLKRRQLWAKAVRRLDWAPSRHSVICSEHFKEECFDRTSLVVVRIKDNAIPTKFAFPSQHQSNLKEQSNLHGQENNDSSLRFSCESKNCLDWPVEIGLCIQLEVPVPRNDSTPEKQAEHQVPGFELRHSFETLIEKKLRERLKQSDSRIALQKSKISILNKKIGVMRRRITKLKNIINGENCIEILSSGDFAPPKMTVI